MPRGTRDFLTELYPCSNLTRDLSIVLPHPLPTPAPRGITTKRFRNEYVFCDENYKCNSETRRIETVLGDKNYRRKLLVATPRHVVFKQFLVIKTTDAS